jgi:hypothetical protein
MKFGTIICAATIAFGTMPCTALANDVLRAESRLTFEGAAGGEVWVNFDARWTNTTAKALCIREGNVSRLERF